MILNLVNLWDLVNLWWWWYLVKRVLELWILGPERWVLLEGLICNVWRVLPRGVMERLVHVLGWVDRVCKCLFIYYLEVWATVCPMFCAKAVIAI